MTVDLEPYLDAAGKFGLAVVLVMALWYAVTVPRKDKDGNPKSSLLVPGWTHDQMVETHRHEQEGVREFYQKALLDEQDRSIQRVAEWRGFRDEALARAKDAEEDTKALLAAVATLTTDVQRLIVIVGDLEKRMAISQVAEGESSQSGHARTTRRG